MLGATLVHHLHLMLKLLSRGDHLMIQTNRVIIHQNLLATRSACNLTCLKHLVKIPEHLLVFLRIVVNRRGACTPFL